MLSAQKTILKQVCGIPKDWPCVVRREVDYLKHVHPQPTSAERTKGAFDEH